LCPYFMDFFVSSWSHFVCVLSELCG
jgi:hypothetical protein